MKRIALVAGLFAVATGFLLVPHANARPACGAGDDVNVDVVVGSACAGGDPAAAQGHAYVDGNNDNPSLLAGYLGGNNDDPDTPDGAIVGCASGDYADDTDPPTSETDPPGDGDADPNVIIDLGNPNPSADPNSPCVPS